MSAKSNLLERVKETILKHSMIRPGEVVIAAVSGGPDSICLLDVLTGLSEEMDISLIIAHYEHGLRPEEDVFETELVKRYADSFGIPFETEKASGLSKDDSSLEEKAREYRYDFLERTRKKYKAQKIVMGHNLNDQAETVIMRLLRGSGMTGLSGIPPVRDNTVIRPLIEIKREDIITYLEHKNLEYAIDSSNNDNKFLRNKIRLELLPEMLKYQPGIIDVLGNLAENLRDENNFFESYTEQWVNENLKQNESGDSVVDITLLKDLPVALIRRIIRNIVKRHCKTLYGMDSENVRDIIDLTANTRPNIKIDLPGNLIVKKEYDKLIFTSRITDFDSFFYEFIKSGKLYIKEIGKTLVLEELGNDPQIVTNNNNTAFLDKDLLPYPLTIREYRPGDRFIPLGMKGHKKVKDFFIDLKVPMVLRKKTPILLKDDNIVWLCGYRINDRYKVTSNTKNILKITIS